MRREALQFKIPFITTVNGLKMSIRAMENRQENPEVCALQDFYQSGILARNSQETVLEAC